MKRIYPEVAKRRASLKHEVCGHYLQHPPPGLSPCGFNSSYSHRVQRGRAVPSTSLFQHFGLPFTKTFPHNQNRKPELNGGGGGVLGLEEGMSTLEYT